MKKIIRTAIVIALAGAALLSTGCTKDVSSDINALQTQVTELQKTVAALNAFKAEAQIQLDEHETDLKALVISIALLGTKIDEYETATDAQLAALNEKVEKQVTEIYEAITAVTGRVATLEAAYESVKTAIEALAAQINAVAARITSIVAVPSTNAEILAVNAAAVSTAADTTIKTFVAEFEVSPAKAADRLTDADLQINFKEGISKDPIDVSADVKIVKNENGVITIKAFAPNAALADGNSLYYSLSYAGKDEADSTYYVQSAYTKAASRNVKVNYALLKGDKVMSCFVSATDAFNDTTVTAFDVLAPVALYDENISLRACVDGKYYTMKEYAELLGIAEPEVTTRDIICRYKTLKGFGIDLNGPFKKNDECVAAAAVLFDTTKVEAYRAAGTIAKAIGADKANKSIGCTYLVNGVAVCTLDRFAVLSKRVKTDADVVAAQKTTWNYTCSANVSDTKTDVKVPSFYAGATLKDSKITPKEDYNLVPTYTGTSAAFELTKIPFGKETVDYTIEMSYVGDTLNSTLNIPWTVTKKADDVVLDLGDSTVAFAASGTVDVTVNGVIARAVADTAIWVGETGTSKAALYTYMAGQMKQMSDSVYCDGKKSDAYAVLTWANDKVYVQLTGVKPGKTYKVYSTNTVTGVKFSFTQNIAVKDIEYKLATDPLFVKDGVVTAKGYVESGKYDLYSVDLSNYFKVDGTIPSGDAIKVKFSTYTEHDRTTDTLGTGAAPAAPAPATVTNSTGRIESAKVDWTLTATKLVVKAVLVNTNDCALGDALSINIETPQAVKDFKAGEVSVDRVNGQDLVIKVWTNIFAASCLSDATNIFAPNAATFAAAVAGSIDYGQKVSYDFSKAKAELNGAAYTLDSKNFTFDQTNGTLTVSKDCGQFTAPLKITIPATANYYLDYAGNKALKSDLVITINQK